VMEQADLFDEQTRQLRRVRSKIARAIMRYFQNAAPGKTFHLADLVWWIEWLEIPVSPDSPSRVMRDLRQRRIINYRVVNRAQSLYRVEEI